MASGIRKTQEQFEAEVKSKNKKIEVIGKYINANETIRVKCLLDGYEWEPIANSLIKKNKNGCPLCSNQKVVAGINDLQTTYPEIHKWLFDKTKLYSYGTSKSELFQCPDCNYTFKRLIRTACKNGIICPKCGDSTSFGEKIVTSLLENLGVNYKREYRPKWSKNKRYDFYLTDSNIIIEAHGKQHYSSNCFDSFGEKTLEQEQKNDEFKKQLAVNNGVKKYIVVDFQKSEIDYIKNSILNSELVQIYDLSHVNWDAIGKSVYHSRIKESVELWDSGMRISDIAKLTNRERHTISKYLKIGNEVGLCKYDGTTSRELYKRKIVCKTTREIFDSMLYAKKFYNIAIHMERNSSGKLPDGTPLQWEYFDEGKDYSGYTHIT